MPMSDPDCIVWSALFARTNYGHEMPVSTEVRAYRTAAKHGTSLKAMVNMVCADLLETDEDYDMFVEEAESWSEKLRVKELDYIFNTWPHKRAVWEASEVPA